MLTSLKNSLAIFTISLNTEPIKNLTTNFPSFFNISLAKNIASINERLKNFEKKDDS